MSCVASESPRDIDRLQSAPFGRTLRRVRRVTVYADGRNIVTQPLTATIAPDLVCHMHQIRKPRSGEQGRSVCGTTAKRGGIVNAPTGGSSQISSFSSGQRHLQWGGCGHGGELSRLAGLLGSGRVSSTRYSGRTTRWNGETRVKASLRSPVRAISAG